MKNVAKVVVFSLMLAPMALVSACDSKRCCAEKSAEHHQKHAKMKQEQGGK